MSGKRRCMIAEKRCVVCGEPFKPRAHHQAFCGDLCRKARRAEEARLAGSRATRQRELRSGATRFTRNGICSECGTEFRTTSARKQTCTSACSSARQRRRTSEKVLSEAQLKRRNELRNHRREADGDAARQAEAGYQWWQRRLKPVNDSLRSEAHRHGQEWTGPELEIALRKDLSAQQAAILLGRTLSAVNAARYRTKHFPREIQLAGVSDSRRYTTSGLDEFHPDTTTNPEA